VATHGHTPSTSIRGDFMAITSSGFCAACGPKKPNVFVSVVETNTATEDLINLGGRNRLLAEAPPIHV
jgi:hypothetical protein